MLVQIKKSFIDATYRRARRCCFAIVIGISSIVAGMLTAQAQTVHELTIATPNVIAVEVRDPPFQTGRIQPLQIPSREEHGSWVKAGGEWGRVIGRDRSQVRISDTPPSAFLDHTLIDSPAGYGEISGSRVTAVYRKSVPYDSGIYRGTGGGTMTGASLKHYIYLELSAPLREGSHVIRWPAGTLPETAFDYSSMRTRAIALRVNQLGYRATDEGKIGYLSLWIPGGPTEGAVDFRDRGIKTFQIIDEKGEVQFSASITLRTAPGDPEPGNGLPAPILEYPSASQPATRISRVDAGPPIRFIAPGHRFASGQRVWLDGFSNSEKGLNGFATVEKASPDQFTITEVPADSGAPNSMGNPLAYPVHQANRAGTFVFMLDFGSWKPAREGQYRIHVPGLGVSDPFEIRDNIWLQAGKTAVGGLYNHRSGIALDGRFGFTRPASFRPGPLTTVQLSKLPLSWTTNSSYGFVPAGDGGKTPWVMSDIAPSSYWGGYMDAGDWDRRIDHIDISFLLLDIFESSPEVLRSTALGIPKSSEVLDRDLYTEIDDVPDILHEAVWTLDFFRRLQLPDGSVRGGIESTEHPFLGEPSFLEHLAVFAYAPDPISTYRYASGAAKLAGVLDRIGKPRLAQVYRQSALGAWRAAETMYRDPEASQAEAKAIATASGAFREASWETRELQLRKAASEHRAAAAASLFRLTGDKEYETIFGAAWTSPVDLYQHNADGAWEYYQSRSPIANKDLQKRIGQGFEAAARLIANAQNSFAYASMKHPFAPIGWGQGLAPDYNQIQLFIRAHQIGGDKELLRTMQIASAHILGANQVGLSFTTGLGLRTVKHPLHEDHRAMGVKAPDGITIYGWAPQARTSHEWIFGPEWSPLPITGTRENARHRRVAPNRFAMPFYEYLIEHPSLVMQQEYTVMQSIAPTAGMWLYLHATGGENSVGNTSRR